MSGGKLVMKNGIEWLESMGKKLEMVRQQMSVLDGYVQLHFAPFGPCLYL